MDACPQNLHWQATPPQNWQIFCIFWILWSYTSALSSAIINAELKCTSVQQDLWSQCSQADQVYAYWIGNTIFVTSARVWGDLVSIDFLFIDVKIVDVYGTCCAVLSPALCWHRARTNNRWDSFCQQLQCWMGILARERFRSSSSSYQSLEASEIMHLKVLFDLHHSDSSPLNGSGNGELIFVYRLEDFPWFPIKTSLSLRSLEYQFQYPRSCLELP